MNAYDKIADNLQKGLIDNDTALNAVEVLDKLSKGGKRAFIGEIREFAGRKHIKTPEGWKFYGKGTGEKATAHNKTHGGHEQTGLGRIEHEATNDKNHKLFDKVNALRREGKHIEAATHVFSMDKDHPLKQSLLQDRDFAKHSQIAMAVKNAHIAVSQDNDDGDIDLADEKLRSTYGDNVADDFGDQLDDLAAGGNLHKTAQAVDKIISKYKQSESAKPQGPLSIETPHEKSTDYNDTISVKANNHNAIHDELTGNGYHLTGNGMDDKSGPIQEYKNNKTGDRIHVQKLHTSNVSKKIPSTRVDDPYDDEYEQKVDRLGVQSGSSVIKMLSQVTDIKVNFNGVQTSSKKVIEEIKKNPKAKFNVNDDGDIASVSENKLRDKESPKASSKQFDATGLSYDEAKAKVGTISSLPSSAQDVSNKLAMAGKMNPSAIRKTLNLQKSNAKSWSRLTYGSDNYPGKKGYAQAKQNHDNLVSGLSKLLDEKASSIKVITPSKKALGFKNGKLSVDGIGIHSDDSTGIVHISTKGPIKSNLGFQPGNAKATQLQGNKYVHTVQRIENRLLEGKSFKEIDSDLSSSRDSSSWQEVKHYLGL